MTSPNKPQQPIEDDDAAPQASRSIEWYAEGESRVIEFDDVRVVVRFISRKGRRGRIMITAPAGATFRS